jgi:hypothetical protein
VKTLLQNPQRGEVEVEVKVEGENTVHGARRTVDGPVIEVRRATLADKQAIFKFLPKAYTGRSQYKFPERWEWQFEKNPFRRGCELPVWIAVDEGGAVVGQIGAMFEPLRIGAEVHRLGWAVDLVVLPECRGQKVGFKLTTAIHHGSDILMALPMSEAFRCFVTKLGSIPVDTVTVFGRVARFDPPHVLAALRCRLQNRWSGKSLLWLLHFLGFDRLIAALVNLSVGIRDIGLSRYINADIAVTRIDEFDQATDQFWNVVSPQFNAIVQRNSEYLNWKYVQQPHMDYQLFTASRCGKLCGHVILRKTRPPESNSGIIADLLVPFEDRATIHSLLAFAVRYFKDQNVNHISAASSVDAYKNALSALGFRQEEDVTPLFHSRVATPAIRSALAAGSWFLGRSDHDWDQFPYAQL